MKKLLLILIFLGLDLGQIQAQNLYQDSAIHKIACVVNLTDSSSQIYAMPLKLHIDIFDRGDSVNGVTFTFYMYSVSPRNPTMVNTNSISLSGAYYNGWDANDDRATYRIIQAGLASQKINIEFQ